MNTIQIRDLIGQNDLREAIENTKIIAQENQKLINQANTVSNAFEEYNDNIITGLLSDSEKGIAHAKIVNQITLLLDKIDLFYVHSLTQSLNEISEKTTEMKDASAAKVSDELISIAEENKTNEFVVKKENIKKGPLQKLGQFLTKVSEEDSKERKLVDGISQGFNTVKKIARFYNHVADWLLLPHVPQILLM